MSPTAMTVAAGHHDSLSAMPHTEQNEIARILATIGVVMRHDKCSLGHVSNIGFPQIERKLRLAFQEGPTGFMRFLSVHISFLLQHRNIIGITIVHHRWFPPSIFSRSDRSPREDPEIACPSIFTRFLVQRIWIHLLMNLIELIILLFAERLYGRSRVARWLFFRIEMKPDKSVLPPRSNYD